jgi:hypothetical protein
LTSVGQWRGGARSAGGGVDRGGELTTTGRGGSDMEGGLNGPIEMEILVFLSFSKFCFSFSCFCWFFYVVF